jgi:UDP-3-O-[3-hydroxymyristoyl] glucosamine N-acyltransferase
VVLGGQCGVNDNIFVGDDVVAGGVHQDLHQRAGGPVLLGSPP